MGILKKIEDFLYIDTKNQYFEIKIPNEIFKNYNIVLSYSKKKLNEDILELIEKRIKEFSENNPNVKIHLKEEVKIEEQKTTQL